MAIRQGFIPLSEILEKYRPPYAGTWEKWFNNESKETKELIARLSEELKITGNFEDPVILSYNESEWDEKANQVDYYKASLCDGMHRVAAHYLTGVTPVFVQWGYQTEGLNEEFFSVNVDFSGKTDDEVMDYWDKLSEALSWRHYQDGKSFWVNVEGISSYEGVSEFQFYGIDRNEVNSQILLEDISEILAKHSVKVISGSWNIWNEESHDFDILESCELSNI